MNILINLLRRIVDKYDEKKGLRKKTPFMCHSWDTRNRYKLPEWQTAKGEPLCPVYKDDRCCGCCELSGSCDHAVNCNCYGFAKAALGGTTESEYMRKSSPYYKFGRMKDDGSFDWDFYRLNKAKDEMVPGKYAGIQDFDKLGLPETVVNEMKEKNLKVGLIVEGVNEKGSCKLNLSEDNNGDDYIVVVLYEGLNSYPYHSYERAKLFTHS